jgi:dihydroflavonol-4-reductase
MRFSGNTPSSIITWKVECRMIVVTGATGHIGNVLVRQLYNQRGRRHRIRVLVPPGETMEPLRDTVVETAVCDVTDYASVLRNIRGAELVFHLAGIVSIVNGRQELLRRVNVQGTKNVLDAAREAQVRRVVYVSSVHAFVEPPDGCEINERTPVDPVKVLGDYAKTKAEATLYARQAAAAGQDIVIVHPTGVIGPYEFRNSHTGAMLKGVMKKRYPMKICGRYDFVDVRDVAAGILLAAEKGRSGESYILGGNAITVGELFEIVARLCGLKPPKHSAPVWLVKAVAPITEAWSRLWKKTPTLTPYALKTLFSNSNISCAKARMELGYAPRPIAATLADFVRWAKNEDVGYV